MLYCDHYIALFMAGFDVAVRFDDLIQRVHPVNDRFELPRLDDGLER